ncbi:hypothetical protein F2Q70_00013579 [Brassica cretica]|uniref:Uncharacterized protein n=1 Tax=Brassica cretica TaxID=69181 RepID=A0A8S9M1Z4_BRACR|nr:hypothetical protein F2Q68_00006603 [Brassica cretica]KAF2611938.1 hypothetical protein F2Q70_00013579 [Brassica cretica]
MRTHETRVYRKNYIPTEHVPQTIPTNGVLGLYRWTMVLEYHMEFLGTFGCIWSSKEVIRVIFGRALPGATSRSDYMKSMCITSRSDQPRATISSRSSQSDLPERRHELARPIRFGATS